MDICKTFTNKQRLSDTSADFFKINFDPWVFFIPCYSEPTVIQIQRVDWFWLCTTIRTGLRVSSFLMFHSSSLLDDGWSFYWRCEISHGSSNMSPQTVWCTNDIQYNLKKGERWFVPFFLFLLCRHRDLNRGPLVQMTSMLNHSTTLPPPHKCWLCFHENTSLPNIFNSPKLSRQLNYISSCKYFFQWANF
jgi:hypothetical protein